MAPPEWAEGTSWLDWLHQCGPSYQVAACRKTKVSFLERLYHNWFEKYHWSLDVKTEPNPTMVYIEPVDEETILKKIRPLSREKQYVWILFSCHPNFSHYIQSLSHWFWNRYDDDNPTKSNVISHNPFPTVNASNLLLATKVKSSAKMKPKISQVEHVYSVIYYTKKIWLLLDECWAKEEGKMDPKGKPVSKIVVSQALTKEMWENKSQQVHAEIEEECQRWYKAALKEYEHVQFIGSQSLQQFQK
jgi:hypothetical protein